MSNIHGFTRLAETAEPATVLTWLNEFFGEMVPLITAHDGVVSQFEGDALMAFFGILPRPLPPQESAHEACQAALDMLAAVEKLNARRIARGESPASLAKKAAP
jgi:adenylate cyclase